MDNQYISLLLEAIKCDKLDTDVSGILEHMKKEKVLDIHSFNITEPKSNNARWQTYIRSESGGRVKVSSKTEKGLYEKLYNYYFVEKAQTLGTFYPEWIAKRCEQGVCPRTVRRNENHWNKYYSDNPVINIPLDKLDSERIEKFFHDTIKKYGLTVKELGNMKYIMSDMLKLAKKRKIISFNPMLDVDIRLNGCVPQKKQNDTSRVYLPEEKAKMFIALNRERISKPDNTDVYAVFLLFKLGLRLGEVVALKWSDIDYFNQELHVHRMQTMGDNGNGHLCECIAEYTKKKSPYGDRFLPLSDYEMEIFKTVRLINESNGFKEDDFIFCDEKGRTKERAIDNLIRKCCNKAGIEVKSAHDIRRTVASEMFNNNIPVEIIRNYLGHSDIKTTYGYILDNQGKEKTNRMILESLKSLNGLKGTHVS